MNSDPIKDQPMEDPIKAEYDKSTQLFAGALESNGATSMLPTFWEAMELYINPTDIQDCADETSRIHQRMQIFNSMVGCLCTCAKDDNHNTEVVFKAIVGLVDMDRAVRAIADRQDAATRFINKVQRIVVRSKTWRSDCVSLGWNDLTVSTPLVLFLWRQHMHTDQLHTSPAWKAGHQAAKSASDAVIQKLSESAAFDKTAWDLEKEGLEKQQKGLEKQLSDLQATLQQQPTASSVSDLHNKMEAMHTDIKAIKANGVAKPGFAFRAPNDTDGYTPPTGGLFGNGAPNDTEHPPPTTLVGMMDDKQARRPIPDGIPENIESTLKNIESTATAGGKRRRNDPVKNQAAKKTAVNPAAVNPAAVNPAVVGPLIFNDFIQ
jgi:hypothetical protein